jgi:sulfatase modifying factor 1
MNFVPIPAGEFEMGTPNYFRDTFGYLDVNLMAERPRHHVALSHPFSMSMYEVTVGQFRAFIDATGYKTTAETKGGGTHLSSRSSQNWSEQSPDYIWKAPGFEQDENHPVTQISFDDAQKFCQWLSSKEGKTYRLPTEAEWEYACRAGSSSSWSFADNPWYLHQIANTPDHALQLKLPGYGVAMDWNDGYAFTAPVGSFAPNSFGLYDMHGNVWECWYDAGGYAPGDVTDPQGPASGKKRAQRGGSFAQHFILSRSASRDHDAPDRMQSWVGFRPILETK